MKVCHLTSVHPAFDTRIFYKECKSLAKAGYEVILIAQHSHNEIVDGIQIQALPKPKNRLERMTKIVWKLLNKALEENVKIYHFHDPELIPVGLFLHFIGKKVIYDVHEDFSNQLKGKDWLIFPSIFRLLFKLTKIIADKSFLVVLAEKGYQSIYKNCDYIIVQNMPNLDIFPKAINDDTKQKSKSIAYLGGITRLRGISSIIDSIALLKNRISAFSFHCIGPIYNSEFKEQLYNKVTEYGLGANVFFYERMIAPDAYKILSQCSIGLATLHPHPNYIHSYPTKLFEYMALGLPVIASNFPLWREIVEDNNCGLVVDPLNPKEIATAIEFLLENPELRKEMAENGRKIIIEKYNWENEAKKLLRLYNNLNDS